MITEKRQRGINIIAILCLLCLVSFLHAQEEKMRISITPKNAHLLVGEEIQFSAEMTNKNGEVISTTFSWSLGGHAVGSITQDGLFSAESRGAAKVFAKAEGFVGRANIVVKDTTKNDTTKIRHGQHIIVVPRDTLLMVNEQVEFKAFLVDSQGTVLEPISPEWWLIGQDIGTITDQGVYTAVEHGVNLVKIRYKNKMGIAKVIVATEEDLTEANSLDVGFKHRNGNSAGPLHQLGESDILKISGLPFPLNILNGGELIFPPGALTEDISISISLTEFAEISQDNSLTFQEQVLGGVSIDVSVNGEVVSPYYFEEPVIISLPYKEELMDSLGLSVEDLWIFFYDDESGFEAEGISNIVVDEENDRILAEVIHFSEIVVADHSKISGSPTDIARSPEAQPAEFELLGNYPNPFNPSTEIRFRITGPSSIPVKMTVFNSLGQKVKVLVDKPMQPGEYRINWQGMDMSNNPVGSGIYFITLESGQSIQTQKMALIR